MEEVPKMIKSKTHHESTKKSDWVYTTLSSFVLSSRAKLTAGKFRVFVVDCSSF
jgi:hypothetical protein